jgi:hypothetical protein
MVSLFSTSLVLIPLGWIYNNLRIKVIKFCILLMGLAISGSIFHKSPIALVILFIILNAILTKKDVFCISFFKTVFFGIFSLFVVCTSMLMYSEVTSQFKFSYLQNYCCDILRRLTCRVSELDVCWCDGATYHNFYGMGSCSFGRLYKFFATADKKKEKEEFLLKQHAIFCCIPLEVLKNKQMRASANCCAVSALFVDFRYWSLLIGILMGACLKYYDNTMQKNIPKIKNKSRTIPYVSYVASIVLTFKIHMTSLGTALLSHGLGIAMIIGLISLYFYFDDFIETKIDPKS